MRITTIAAKIFERIDLNQSGDERNNQKYCDSQSINMLTNAEGNATVLPPCPCLDNGRNKRTFRSSVYSLNPLVCGTSGKDQCPKHGSNTKFASLLWHALSEENNEEERQDRNDGDDPCMLEEPPRLQYYFCGCFCGCCEHRISPSSLRVHRGQ